MTYLLLAAHLSLGAWMLNALTATALVMAALTVANRHWAASQPPFFRSFFRLTPKQRFLALGFGGLGQVGGVFLGYVLLSVHPHPIVGAAILGILMPMALLIVALATRRSVDSQPPILRWYFRLTPKRRGLVLALAGLGEVGVVFLGYVLLRVALTN